MAKELAEVMAHLGFPRFSVVGHDRGGRVSYRLALDHPERVDRLAVFDVIPISEAWAHADAKFAKTYWPWALLSQKAPLPEKYLSGAPGAVFDNPFGQGSFGPEVREEYTETYRDPARVHAICEEYRAAATLDVEHDETSQRDSLRIKSPMLHLWAVGATRSTNDWVDRLASGAIGRTTSRDARSRVVISSRKNIPMKRPSFWPNFFPHDHDFKETRKWKNGKLLFR